MTTGERLAAFLAGDLGADESAALQAELARDPALRAQLDRLRAVEGLLGDLGDVEPPADFSANLRTAVRAEVASLPDDGVVVPATELVRRRERRRLFVQRAGAATAAAAAVLAGVVVVGNVGGGDDSATTADAARDFDADTGAMDGGGADMAEMAPAPAGAQPVLATGGNYDPDNLGGLASDGRLLSALDAASQDPAAMARAARDLGIGIDQTSRAMSAPVATTDSAAGDTALDEDAADDAVPVGPEEALAEGLLDPVTLANRCLPAIYTEDRELVPLWLETATFDGEPALVVVLASRGPDGDLSRMELYAFGAEDCHVLFFQQVDR